MNVSISNIAWEAKHDNDMYAFLNNAGFSGLEIAPTRIFPENPYERISEAKDFAAQLKEDYGLCIPSMQSIWFGRQETIFGSEQERRVLIEYTREACKFAQALGCHNLVFGNPRNRETRDVPGDYPKATAFFHAIGEIALEYETIIAIEANPTIYNTHFINYTEQAVELACKSNSKGIKVNYDLGTVIQNGEDVRYITQVADYINHIHISEPYLAPIDISHKDMHAFLLDVSKQLERVFVSIEMGNKGDLTRVKDTVNYIRELSV